MKFILATSTASLFLLLGAATPARAQDHSKGGKSEDHDAQRGKPAQQEKGQSRDQGKPSHDQGSAPVAREKPHAEQAKPAHEQTQPRVQTQQRQAPAPSRPRIIPPPPPPLPHPVRPPQQARSWQQHRGWENNGSWHGHNNWKEHRSERWESDHRNWAQRGGYGGFYIPQPAYVLYFGPSHFFRFQRAPVIYMGYPRFYYQNTSFIMVDPWPSSWDDNWYDNDDVYIVYDDGYYMHNRRDPGISIAISIVQ